MLSSCLVLATAPFTTVEADVVLDIAAVLLPAPSGDGSSLRLLASSGVELEEDEAGRVGRALLVLLDITTSSKSLISSCFRLDVAGAARGEAAEPVGLGDWVGVTDGRGGGGVCEARRTCCAVDEGGPRLTCGFCGNECRRGAEADVALETDPCELEADIGVAAPELDVSVGDDLFFGLSFISTSEPFAEPVPSAFGTFFFTGAVETPLVEVDLTIPCFTDEADSVPPVAFGGSDIFFIFNLRCIVPGTDVPDADLAPCFFFHFASPSCKLRRSGADGGNRD